MRVLHFYLDEDKLIKKYVNVLSESMGLECTNEIASDPSVVQQRLQSSHYDILHIHGCWRTSSYFVMRKALKNNTRIVITLHGQLNPWVISSDYCKEKLPKRIIFMKRLVERAYAVIVQGRIEEENFIRLGWSQRSVVVRNILLTHSINRQEMATQIFRIYRRVMDSDPLKLMDEDTRQLTHQLIKTGITGDRRWLAEEPMSQPDTLEKWRQLLCYAHQEHIMDTVRHGLYVFGYDTPNLDVQNITYFLPVRYKEVETIGKTIGMSFVSENDRLMATFRYASKLVDRHQLTIMHLIELDKELREHSCDEDSLCERLEEQHLAKFTGRLMMALQKITGLTEGFMPVYPIDDHVSRNICKQVENHLSI